MDRVVIGTRASSLALAQAEEVRGLLKKRFPEVDFQLKEIRTAGDKTEKLLSRHAEEVGFFTKELEEFLLSKAIDIAVHSLKDLPTKHPEPLQIAAVTKRENPQDALVTEEGKTLSDLPEGVRIGTGSARRKAQLLYFNPKFEVVGIRGNLDTRFRKLKEKSFDALVLAMAGLGRLKAAPQKIWPIPYNIMLPAPGQGALAVQIRKGEKELEKRVSTLDHPESRQCVTAERSFLAHLGGGCQLPLGALGVVRNGEIVLNGVLVREDGKERIRFGMSGKKPEEVGLKLAEKFLEMGAEALLHA